MNKLPRPPRQLDGADLILWSESASGLFHTIPHGSDSEAENVDCVADLAICRYSNESSFYLFKCDRNWNVVFDWDASSVEAAQEIAASHVKDEVIEWQPAD